MLWQGTGLAPSLVEDIYLGCVVAYGLLVAITFLSYYVTCYDVPLPSTTVKCFCDNLGIITNLCSLQSEQIPCPNDATNNDWDIYLEVHATATKSPAL